MCVIYMHAAVETKHFRKNFTTREIRMQADRKLPALFMYNAMAALDSGSQIMVSGNRELNYFSRKRSHRRCSNGKIATIKTCERLRYF